VPERPARATWVDTAATTIRAGQLAGPKTGVGRGGGDPPHTYVFGRPASMGDR